VAAKRPSLVDASREIAQADPIMGIDQVFGPIARTPEGPEAVTPDGQNAVPLGKPLAPKLDLVSPTVHLRKETLHLLRRVATARSLKDDKRPSISRVIESLVDAARDDLEREASGLSG
jgi:hypothetical protein